MKFCAIIPSHNHYTALPAIVARLKQEGLAVFITDDGSEQTARVAIAALHNPQNGITVQRNETCAGKGAAVLAAMRAAITAGYTHALQVDADGQHDLTALPRFIALARHHPDALICGRPIYDTSVPAGRRIGRWITHFWVWVETLSLRIPDSMCGFRLYPLQHCAALFARTLPRSGMDFDTDIIVRLFWRGVAPVWLGVRVSYPPDNTSNFHMLRDNLRISLMHTRLVLTMLAHLPWILAHRPPHPEAAGHWARLPERGVYLGLKFCAMLSRLAGPTGRRLLVSPVVLYFFTTGKTQRRASYDFLTRALGRPPTRREQWLHFLNFGLRALDVFQGWTGKLPADQLQAEDPAQLAAIAAEKKGCLMVVAHLGNVEVVRALIAPAIRDKVTVLVHTRNAVNFNRIISENTGDYASNLVQVTEIGPETLIALRTRLENGGIVIIAGDRTPVLSHGHCVHAPFFGKDAPFPTGPWLLAALLECPVYLMQCLQRDGRYHLSIAPFSRRITLPRTSRQDALRTIVARYAATLEKQAAAAPLQWYNFFDFWGQA